MNEEDDKKEEDEDEGEWEMEIIFEPSAQLKADVIWGENKCQSDTSSE